MMIFKSQKAPFQVLLLSLLLWALIFPPILRAATAPDLEEAYQESKKAYLALEKSPQRLNRQNWQPLIDQFTQCYRQQPQSPWGEKSMFMLGRIYLNLYQWSGGPVDLDQAQDYFTRFTNHYPDSPLADDALFKLAEIQQRFKKNPDQARELLQTLLSKYPQGDMKKKAEDLLAQMGKTAPAAVNPPLEYPAEILPLEEKRATPPPETAARSLPQVTGLRHWSTPEYTRIVVDVEERVSLRQRLLKKDPTIEKPERLFLDLYPARLNKELKEPLAIRDGLLRAARAGQYDLSTVRIVLDIESIKGYKVFFLENPFRVIIDVTGKKKEVATPLPEPPAKDQKLSLAQQLGLGVKRVVIDAGHGGKDKGAIGEGALYEKDLNLQLAKKLAQKIRQELKIQAIMTRETDRFIPLEERTAIANTRQADLFLSIHVNASPNPLAQGVETYFLNLASDEEAVRVAAMENATSTKRIGDLQKILKDLMLNTKIDESSRLAHHVQLHLHDTLNGKFGPIKNLGVKQAPFYVLIGAQMPSILVEASFISNSQDRERLMQEDYQDQIVEGIFKGVERYIKETKLGGNQPEASPGRSARR